MSSSVAFVGCTHADRYYILANVDCSFTSTTNFVRGLAIVGDLYRSLVAGLNCETDWSLH